jgi:K(+)-stimulated pyrophosphate-energized sodium pump
MMLISTELLIMLGILLFVPRELAGKCFIGFAIGESLGAAALRIAGGIFTKIADIGSDLMKIVFKVKEDDARNPGVIADCTGDNAGDSVGPTADGFETYGVTGVALISFILLAVPEAGGPGPAAGLDLRDARDDDRRLRRSPTSATKWSSKAQVRATPITSTSKRR